MYVKQPRIMVTSYPNGISTFQGFFWSFQDQIGINLNLSDFDRAIELSSRFQNLGK